MSAASNCAPVRVVRVITSVTSLPASLTFYRDLLGADHRYTEGDVASLETQDGIELLLPNGMLSRATPRSVSASFSPTSKVSSSAGPSRAVRSSIPR